MNAIFLFPCIAKRRKAKPFLQLKKAAPENKTLQNTARTYLKRYANNQATRWRYKGQKHKDMQGHFLEAIWSPEGCTGEKKCKRNKTFREKSARSNSCQNRRQKLVNL